MRKRRCNVDEDPVGNQIRRGLRSLRKGFVVLIITPAEHYLTSTVTFMDYAINEEGMRGVYVTANRPYVNLVNMFKERAISPDSLLFVDCISAMAGEKTGRSGNCIYVPSPLELERITDYVDTLLDELGDETKRFIYLDSLSTFLLYNSVSSVGKLSHFLINRLRLKNMSGVFLTLELEAPTELIQRLTVLCDKVVRVRSYEEASHVLAAET